MATQDTILVPFLWGPLIFSVYFWGQRSLPITFSWLARRPCVYQYELNVNKSYRLSSHAPGTVLSKTLSTSTEPLGIQLWINSPEAYSPLGVTATQQQPLNDYREQSPTQGRARTPWKSVSNLLLFYSHIAMGARRCSSSFFRQDNGCWESLNQFISERECRDSTQSLSDAKDLVSSAVLDAHIQKQNYSPPWEVYPLHFNLAMSSIIDELDDQSFRGPVKFLRLYATLRGNVHVFLGRRPLDYTLFSKGSMTVRVY